MYTDIFYNNYHMDVEIPFVWPYSLLRISIISLFGVIFCGLCSISYAKKLMHCGPVYIISPDGIMDCRFGFIPWSQITKISADIRGPLPTDAIIHISGFAPEDHLKSSWRPYFGARLILISLSPKIMRYEYLDNETNQLK